MIMTEKEKQIIQSMMGAVQGLCFSFDYNCKHLPATVCQALNGVLSVGLRIRKQRHAAGKW